MRKIVVVALTLAVSVAGHSKAQSSVKKFEPVSGEVAEKAKAEIMQVEREMVPLHLKGGNTWSGFLNRIDTDDVDMIDGDGELHSMADYQTLWRSGQLKLQNEIRWDYKILIYDHGNVAAMTYLSTTDFTRDGKEQVHHGRLTDVWVKQDGQWLRVLHAGAGKGR